MEQRQEAAMYGLDLIKDYPVFGSGPGTWYVAYPKYRGPDIVKFSTTRTTISYSSQPRAGWWGWGSWGLWCYGR